MGTRADFYVGAGKDAEWIGSIAWDGYEWAEDSQTPIRQATTETSFRHCVWAELTKRRDATFPNMGWPWPWEDSTTTDFAYCWVDDHLEIYCFGAPYADGEKAVPRPDWPDMTNRQNVTFGPRSGVVIITG